MQTIDILIIGGGPGGLSTALHLHQLTPELATRCIVLEKAHYPRPKLCGGGLVADAEILLQRLGLDVREIAHTDAKSIRFNFMGKGLTIGVPGGHALRIIRRDEFDAWLAEKAKSRGIEIREGVTVKNIQLDGNGVTVETDQGDFRAKVIIGADGSNGITRRCVLPNVPVYTARLLEVLAPPPPSLPHFPQPNAKNGGGAHREEGVATFEFSPVPKGIAGYTWDFPTQVNSQPMRCWGVYDSNILSDMQRPSLKDILREEMARHGFNLDAVKLQGHPIRWYDPFNPLAAPRMLLVGDAAGADPLFGEGISMALAYGKLAAQELVSAFSRDDFRFTGYWWRVSTSPLGTTLFSRWLLSYIIYTLRWSWFQFLLWRIIQPVVLLFAWLFILNWGKRMR